jgi:hypothetical protein
MRFFYAFAVASFDQIEYRFHTPLTQRLRAGICPGQRASVGPGERGTRGVDDGRERATAGGYGACSTRRRITQRHLAILRSRLNPNSSNRLSGPVWR